MLLRTTNTTTMLKNLHTSYTPEKKLRLISNEEIAYDLLELSDMLMLPMSTCMHLLYHRLVDNNKEILC